MLTSSGLVDRALAYCGTGKYRMGGGRIDGRWEEGPLGEDGTCDCSAFVMAMLGLPKAGPFAWLRKLNGGWWNTDGIWWDAVDARETGFFRPLGFLSVVGCLADRELPMLADPNPGSILVYPSRETARGVSGPKVGHCAIVVPSHGLPSLDGGAIVHCSSGNQRRHGAAIMRTPIDAVRWPRSTAVVWCDVVGE